MNIKSLKEQEFIFESTNKYIGHLNYQEFSFDIIVKSIPDTDEYIFKLFYITQISALQRVNTNIYKNIFPENIFDMQNSNYFDYIPKTKIILQHNHGFNLYDINIYKLSKADNVQTSFVDGIVTKIIDNNLFEVTTSGLVNYIYDASNKNTSTLYLSDTEAGKMTDIDKITGDIYVPVGYNINNKFIFKTKDGSIGIKPVEYTNNTNNPVAFTNQEIQDIIQEVYNNA